MTKTMLKVLEVEQGRNNNQLVDDEDWVPDDVLINNVGDCVENTNTSEVDSPKDGHPAMKVFVTGPVGAGKSMLIRALAQSVILIANLRPDIDDLSLPPVLLRAPTGKATYEIKGLTLHSAFKLPLNQFAGLLPKLSSNISNTLRCQFAKVKLLIIDEISIVGIKTLGHIDQRLRSILRINKPFGECLTLMNQVSFISEANDTSAKPLDIESAKKLPLQKTIGLALRLVLKETVKYMVIANISTEDGIVNGAIGEDEPDVGSLTRQTIKNKLKPEEHHKVTRIQLPLVEALALMVHKSQGTTYQSVAFHVPQKFLKFNMLYVGCNRATSAHGLRIDYFPAKPSKPSAKVEHEMCRLRIPSCALIPHFSRIMTYNMPLSCIHCGFIETVASAKNNVIFIGDFNINFKKPPKQLVQILKHFNYKILVDGITTDHRTTIDNVITNVDIAVLVYESLISDHRPILVLNNNNLDDIEFIQVDSHTILVPKTKTKSTKIVDYNIINNDIQFIQVNSNTLKVPENCNTRSDSLLEAIIDITSSSIFCGFTKTDGVSCYANSIIQVLYNCQSLVNEIRNNQLGPTLQHSLYEYTSNSGLCNTRTIREYLNDEIILYTLQQQQDCIEFLEALMDRSRPTFKSLFGFQELLQTLQTLFSTNQNVLNTLDDYKCNNCNNIGSSEDKHQVIVANEYIVIQLKLFIPTLVNGQFVPNKITDLKLSGVPTSILEIAGGQYKTQAAILHMGENTSSGHYITYLTQGTSNWVCANDTTVAKKRRPNNSKDVYVIILKRM
ncbi:ubiquitin carboxyl-terminal hydrolase 25-like [Aphis craccivora]|uniref:ATP-dependent DNA helicase n=1 Tax=Aphis craccivora TaxID=307492 RepID=A0A6G0YEN7_APHCR|nr:ubiquitin carboxyl-terminal hydrolase 25-like [Aphis craccivora]